MVSQSKETENSYSNWRKLAQAYLDNGDNDKALKYFHRLLEETKEKGDVLTQSHIYNSIGFVYLRRKDYETSLKFREKSLSLRENLKNSYYIGESYNDIGVVYQAMGNYNKALEHYQLALKHSDVNELTHELGVNYNNLASVCYRLKKKKECEDYYLKAFKVFKQLKEPQQLAEINHNLGIAYITFDELDNALDHFKLSLEWYQSFHDKGMSAVCEKWIADIYFQKKLYRDALGYYQNSLKFFERMDIIKYNEVKVKLDHIQKIMNNIK